MTSNQPTPQEDRLGQILERLEDLKQSDEQLRQEVERFNDRFTNYQQATQWVVQIAFTLIASTTITVIITALLKR